VILRVLPSSIFELILVALFLLSCRAGGGAAGQSASGDNEVEISGSIDGEEPIDFVTAGDSVAITGVNLAASVSFLVSGYAIEPTGTKSLLFRGTFAEPKFNFRSKLPSQYINLEVIRQPDGGKFGAILPPPPLKSFRATVAVDGTTTIAAKLLDVIAGKATSGDSGARTALTNGSLAVSDFLMVAHSLRLTVSEQKSYGAGATIDLTNLATNLVTKSNALMESTIGDWPPSVAAQVRSSFAAKISHAAYDGIFGQDATAASPGILAFRVNLDLGIKQESKKNVAYDAITESNSESMKAVDEAFRVQSTAYRSAPSLESAVASQGQVINTYKVVFDQCVTSPLSCAGTTFSPPQLPSSTGTGSSTSAIPVITIGTHPASQTTTTGTASFTVSATVTGGANLMFQWQKQEGGSGAFSDLSGKNDKTLILENVVPATDNGDVYRVIVKTTDHISSIISNSAVLNVVQAPGEPGNLVASRLVPTNDEIVAEKGRVSLDWDAPLIVGSSPIADYAIEYKPSDSLNWATYSDGVSIATDAILSDLPSGTAYDVRVKALNANGAGIWSSNASVSMPRELYFKNTGARGSSSNFNWSHVGNWFLKNDFSVTASRIPGPYDNVYIYGDMPSTNTGTTATVSNLIVSNEFLRGVETCESPGVNCAYDYPNLILDIDVTVTGIAIFKYSTLDPPAFSGGAVGQEEFSTITGNALFQGSGAFQYGVVTGTVSCVGTSGPMACNPN